MNLTDEDIIKILKIVEQSKFDSMVLEYGDLKLAVGKGGRPPGQDALQQPAASSGTADSPGSGAPVQIEEKVVAQAPKKKGVIDPKAAAAGTAEEENLIPVTSPMVGIFYGSPEPGAEPFAGVGSRVDEDTVVGLIEVMKVFTSVRSGVKGKIARCLVEDAQFVEYGQPLFLVRPEEEKDG